MDFLRVWRHTAVTTAAHGTHRRRAAQIQEYVNLTRPFAREFLCDANQEKLRTIIAEQGLARVLRRVADFTTDEPVACLLQRLVDIVVDEETDE